MSVLISVKLFATKVAANKEKVYIMYLKNGKRPVRGLLSSNVIG